MATGSSEPSSRMRSALQPFRRAVFRGLAVVLPPLLTLVIFLWIGNTVHQYILKPVSGVTRDVVAWYLVRQHDAEPVGEHSESNGRPIVKEPDGDLYVQLVTGIYVPDEVYEAVRRDDPDGVLVADDRGAIFRRYVEVQYLRPQRIIPLLLCLFILLLYLLGKFLAAGVGHFVWRLLEWLIHHLPLVRNVYGSVKQVTDFMLKDKEIGYTRVVAVEYPRQGIWSIGFVTGDSLLDVRLAAGEAVVSLMVPCSPHVMTGYTICVRKSETIDLHMTVDQALQYIISCGVIVPPHQMSQARRPHDFDPRGASRLEPPREKVS